MKRCTKCEIEKPKSEFSKNCTYKEGLKYSCKDCDRLYRQEHRAESNQRRKVLRQTTKGHLRVVFTNMKRRCTDPKAHNYNRYGGRGIRVCFSSSAEFVDYVMNVLQVDPCGLTIDRIDNDGNYGPGNVRFISQAENNQNQSCKKLLLV